MAVRLDEARRGERARIETHAERLRSFVRAGDPDAQFALRLGHDPAFWELDAFAWSCAPAESDGTHQAG